MVKACLGMKLKVGFEVEIFALCGEHTNRHWQACVACRSNLLYIYESCLQNGNLEHAKADCFVPRNDEYVERARADCSSLAMTRTLNMQEHRFVTRNDDK
jgi:hypothetical protein